MKVTWTDNPNPNPNEGDNPNPNEGDNPNPNEGDLNCYWSMEVESNLPYFSISVLTFSDLLNGKASCLSDSTKLIGFSNAGQVIWSISRMEFFQKNRYIWNEFQTRHLWLALLSGLQ